MLLLHAPLTFKVFWAGVFGGPGEASWSSILLLSASNLFFVFEIVFVPCLRLLADRRGAIALLLVVAILHTGVIERCTAGITQDGGVQVWLVLTALGVAGWRVLWRILADYFHTVFCDAVEPRHRLARLLYDPFLMPIIATRRPLCGWRRAPLRAPPM